MPWIQLKLQANSETAQQLADRLDAAGAVSVTMQDSADQPLYEPPPGAVPLWNETTVVGLFEDDCDMTAILAGLAEQAPLPPYDLETLPDQDWSRAWMDAFKPMRFGRRLWIVPSWHEPPDPAAVNILLDPGLAFGTGTHPTTRLCLEWLDATDIAGRSVIDYGSGSGILAIAAALLGAEQVLAIDNDPQAILATDDNASRNDVGNRVQAMLPPDRPESSCDILIANILAGPLVTLAPLFATLVRPGGAVALSGILPEQALTVAAAYEPWFMINPAVEHDGWVRLAGVRRHPGEQSVQG